MEEIDDEIPCKPLPMTNAFPPMPSHNNTHFRLLFTLITKIINETNFGRNLYSINEMQLSYYKNKNEQLIFLQKFLELLSIVNKSNILNIQFSAQDLIEQKGTREQIYQFIEHICALLKSSKEDTTIHEEMIREKYKMQSNIQTEKNNLAVMFNMLKHISQPKYANIHNIYPKVLNSGKIISPIKKKAIYKSALRNNIDDDSNEVFKVVEVNKDKNEIIISKICLSEQERLNDIDYIFECKQ